MAGAAASGAAAPGAVAGAAVSAGASAGLGADVGAAVCAIKLVTVIEQLSAMQGRSRGKRFMVLTSKVNMARCAGSPSV